MCTGVATRMFATVGQARNPLSVRATGRAMFGKRDDALRGEFPDNACHRRRYPDLTSPSLCSRNGYWIEKKGLAEPAPLADRMNYLQ